MEQLLTVMEAAQQLRISRAKLYQLLGPVGEGGEIEAVHVGASRRVLASSLATYIERLREVEAEVG